MTTANPNGRVFWAGLVLILAAFTATAQEFRGLVAGKITDPNGAVVPGNKRNREKNYLESSAACMFVYALAKAVRKGYLPASYMQVAKKGYSGIQKQFLQTDSNGRLNLEGTVNVGGLGGNPYRDGSYEYYMSEKIVTNDPKGIGALIIAATEMKNATKRK